jgi:hypothetical protein
MWVHWCECEHGLLWCADGDPCNWCDAKQFVCDEPEEESENLKERD